jgi:ABC-type lipoprotein export system ATPase subunit/tetratricopeptide (TPR) repeat protein
MSELEVSDLTVEFDSGGYLVRPLDKLSFVAEDGEFVAVIGPSGCGKTTLLSCLAGLLTPTKGHVKFRGDTVSLLSGQALGRYRRETVGVVFQAFNLLPSLSARGNVMAPMRIAGVRRQEAASRADALLELVDLESKIRVRPGQLSGGQQQRVAIARALVHDPPLVLADEPTAHLDYIQVEGIVSLLRQLAAPNRLVVVVTHDDRITNVADRVVELAPKFDLSDHLPETVGLRPNQILFRQGEPSDFVYVVEDGEVELYRDRTDGTRERLSVARSGGYFGELGPTLNLPRSATARALLPTRLTAYPLRTFRKLFRDDHVVPPGRSAEEWLAEVLHAERRGELLQAFDLAERALEDYPENGALRHRAVLALARSGSTAEALRRYEEFRLRDLDTEDTAALEARMKKDVALATSGPDQRERAATAAAAYRSIAERTNGYYPLVNAATMCLVAGDVEGAQALAIAAIDGARSSEPSYYACATESEALLIMGDADGAAGCLERAAPLAEGDYGALATTRRQLRMVCALTQADPRVLAPLSGPAVVHYCGHRFESQAPGRVRNAALERISREIATTIESLQPGFAYGSLASGGDILWAEALSAAGTELHVVLPFAIDKFLETSVAPAGAAWVERFQRCLDAAQSVTFATEDAYLDDDILYTYCANLAMGLALLRARFLDAEAVQLALWDGKPATGVAGTAVDTLTWRRTGHELLVVDPSSGSDESSERDATCSQASSLTIPLPVSEIGPAPDQNGRVIRALLFGDARGFSKLSDEQQRVFWGLVFGTAADVLGRFDSEISYRNSWGDRLFAVFDHVDVAARCAVELQESIEAVDLAGADLPTDMAFRLSAHLGPVYPARDPVQGVTSFLGSHISRTARIESVTPPGAVYVTEAFAAALELHQVSEFACDYVGHLPAAKDYGRMRMYRLRRRFRSMTI